jgi:hypothetical protein
LAIVARGSAEFRRRYAGYARFLAQPWKLITFVIAAAGIALVAPYTGDPTWDWFDALFMSVLTFATAPWAVGVFHNAVRHRVPASHVFVAACAWMFSASWSYDLYLLLRDGYYPVTWAANIAASSVLYACAGLLWNLDYVPGRGVILGFMRESWPMPASHGAFRRIAWAAAPFMAIAAAAILWFVWTTLPGR